MPGFFVGSYIRLQRKMAVESAPPFNITVSSSGGGGGGSVAQYTADGTNNNAPGHASWLSTTTLTDASSGDTTTGVTAGGAGLVLSVMHDNGSNISIASWNQTFGFGGGDPPGTFNTAYAYWDGGAWQNMNDGNMVGWGTVVSFSYISRTATFSSVPSARYFRCVGTADSVEGGSLKATDSRIS